MAINKKMTIEEILRTDYGIANILMESGMHCLGCVMASGEEMCIRDRSIVTTNAMRAIIANARLSRVFMCYLHIVYLPVSYTHLDNPSGEKHHPACFHRCHTAQ